MLTFDLPPLKIFHAAIHVSSACALLLRVRAQCLQAVNLRLDVPLSKSSAAGTILWYDAEPLVRETGRPIMTIAVRLTRFPYHSAQLLHFSCIHFLLPAGHRLMQVAACGQAWECPCILVKFVCLFAPLR